MIIKVNQFENYRKDTNDPLQRVRRDHLPLSFFDLLINEKLDFVKKYNNVLFSLKLTEPRLNSS